MAGERAKDALRRIAGRPDTSEVPEQLRALQEQLSALEAAKVDTLAYDAASRYQRSLEDIETAIIQLGIKNEQVAHLRKRLVPLYERIEKHLNDLESMGRTSAGSLVQKLQERQGDLDNSEPEGEGSTSGPAKVERQETELPAQNALAHFEHARYWDRGQHDVHHDMREPLPIEERALDNLYAVLRDIEAKPERIDEVMKDVSAKVAALVVDKQSRSELRELRVILGHIQRRINGDRRNKERGGMDNEEIRRYAGQFLDALDRVEDGRSLAALPKENVFRDLYLVDSLTQVLPAISGIARQIAKEGESAYRIRPIRQFKGPVRQGLYYGALGLTGAVAFGSFAFAGTGLRNFFVNFVPYIVPFKDTLREYINSLGYDADAAGVRFAQGSGFALAVASTAAMIFYRARHSLNTRQWVLLVTGTSFLLGGATAGLFEKAVNAGDTGKMGLKVGEAAGGMKTTIAGIPDRLKDTKERLVSGAEQIVSAEAADGGPGPKTMFYIVTYLGQATAEQKAAFEQFLREKDPSGKFAKDLEEYKKAFVELAGSDKYKSLGLTWEKVGIKQIIEKAFSTISPQEAVRMFENLLTRGETAAKTSIGGHMVGELDVFGWFGSHDDTLSLGLYKDAVFRKFKGINKGYEGIDSQMQLLIAFLRDLTTKTKVNMLGKEGGARKAAPPPKKGGQQPAAPVVTGGQTIDKILNLPPLGLSDTDFEKADTKIGQAVVKSAFHILLTPEGRAELGEAMRRGTPFKNFNEDDAIHMTLMGLGFFAAYGLVDLGPGIVIERANRRSGRRFKVEAAQKFNEAYKVESAISNFISEHVSRSLSAASAFLNLENLGLEYGLPEEIIAVRVRHNLQKMAVEELPELQDAQRERKGFAINQNSPITAWDPRSPVSWIEAFLGIANEYHSPDAKMANAKIYWLRNIEERLKKGDTALLERLTADIAPQYPHVAPGLFALLKKNPDDPDYAEQKGLLETEVLGMRRAQLEIIAQDLPRHIALLRAAQERIMETTDFAENKEIPLMGKGNLSFSPDYIKQTFLLNRIADDIEEMEASYAQIQELGIRTEQAMGNVISPVFSQKSADMSWHPSSSAEQAALDEIIRANERRVLGLTTGIEKKDMQTFTDYMNAIDMALKPTIEMFQRDLPPALQGRSAIALLYDYNKEEGIPTVSVALLDAPHFRRRERSEKGTVAPRPEGVPEVIASIPFTKFPIPDLGGEIADPRHAIEELSAWLAPQGEAIRAMEAQVRRREIKLMLTDFEDAVIADRTDMAYRIPDELDYVGSKGEARNRLADFAYLKALRGWKAEMDNLFYELSPSGQRKARSVFTSEERTQVESLYSKALVGASAAIDDARLIDSAIQFAVDNMPAGYSLFYDMKPDMPEIIVRGNNKEERVPINKDSREVLETFAAMQKA